MGFLQFLGSAIAFIIGALMFLAAKSAIHETLATTFLIISAVLFAGGAITTWLGNVNTSVKKIGEILIATATTQRETHEPEPKGPAETHLVKQKQPSEKPMTWVEQAKKEMAIEPTKR